MTQRDRDIPESGVNADFSWLSVKCRDVVCARIQRDTISMDGHCCKQLLAAVSSQQLALSVAQ